MIVEQYGLIYRRVEVGDIELVRYWRNQPFIRDTMQFKGYITPNMQLKWFNSINNKYNYYFLVEHQTKKIGLISCKDAEPNTSVAEGGIFIWDKSYWGTPIPVFASLTMLEAVFEIFRSGDASVATIAKDNLRALEFNKILGYEPVGESEDKLFVKLMLTKRNYHLKTKKLQKAAHIYTDGRSQFKVSAVPSDFYVDEINTYLKDQASTSRGKQ